MTTKQNADVSIHIKPMIIRVFSIGVTIRAGYRKYVPHHIAIRNPYSSLYSEGTLQTKKQTNPRAVAIKAIPRTMSRVSVISIGTKWDATLAMKINPSTFKIFSYNFSPPPQFL
jgi:hypothetical protein